MKANNKIDIWGLVLSYIHFGDNKVLERIKSYLDSGSVDMNEFNNLYKKIIKQEREAFEDKWQLNASSLIAGISESLWYMNPYAAFTTFSRPTTPRYQDEDEIPASNKIRLNEIKNIIIRKIDTFKEKPTVPAFCSINNR